MGQIFNSRSFVRGAFAELSAWAVFPWIILFFVKVCDAGRWKDCLGLILTAALFIMCHKIFFAWSVIVLALIGLTIFGWRRILAISPLLLVCLTAALSFSAPYWLNALLASKSMNISGYLGVAWVNLTSDFSI